MVLLLGDLRIWGLMLLAILAIIVISVLYRVSIGYDDDVDPRTPK